MEKLPSRDQHTLTLENQTLNEQGYPKEIFISDPSDMFKCSICCGIFKNAMTCTNQDCGKYLFIPYLLQKNI